MTQDVRKLIVEEMLEKEEGYIAVLKCLVAKFHSPLEEMQKSDRFEKDYMRRSDLRLMFHKLPEILQSHEKARDELRQVVRRWNPKKSDVGKIVVQASKVWADLYPSYIDKHYDALSALDRCESRLRFRSFIETAESDPACGNLRLRDMLIKPVQRMPGIELLVGRLLKNTPANHQDHASLTRALSKMKKLLESSNKHRITSEMQMQTMELVSSIDKLPDDFIRSDRRFISSLDLEAVTATGGIIKERRGQKLRLLLFNGAVLFTKIRTNVRNATDFDESFHRPNASLRRGTSFSMAGLSRQASMTSNAGKKGRKPLRFLSVAEFSSFRTFEYIPAKGIFVLTMRDAITYRACVFRLVKKTSLVTAVTFFDELLTWIGDLDPSRRGERLVELAEEDVKWPKSSSRKADFEMIARVMDNTDDLKDGTICKKSLLNRTLSNISQGVAASFRRFANFATPTASISRYPSNSPTSRACGDDNDGDG